jgi:hypothetical protein
MDAIAVDIHINCGSFSLKIKRGSVKYVAELHDAAAWLIQRAADYLAVSIS